MYIIDLRDGKPHNRITDVIEFGKMPIISVVGAGGKTTIIKQIANEYGRIAVTTTTHMLKECPLAQSADEVNNSGGTVWFGKDDGEKISVSPFIDEVYKIPLIIEADGSKHMPFKVPREHEPAIYRRSTAVIGVLGMDALGQRIKDVSFCPDYAARFLNTDTEHIINQDDFVKVITGKDALMKNVCGSFHVFLNKTDTVSKLKDAVQIARKCENINIYAVSFYG